MNKAVTGLALVILCNSAIGSEAGALYFVTSEDEPRELIETHDAGMRLERRGAGLIAIDTPHVLNTDRPNGSAVRTIGETQPSKPASSALSSKKEPPVIDVIVHRKDQTPPRKKPNPGEDHTEMVLKALERQKNLKITKRQYKKSGDPYQDLTSAGTPGYKTLKDGTQIPVTFVDEEWDEYKAVMGDDYIEHGRSNKMRAGGHKDFK